MNRRVLVWMLLAIPLVSVLILLRFMEMAGKSLTLEDLEGIVLMTGITTVGTLIIYRQPKNHLGWFFLGIGIFWTIPNTLLAYVDYALPMDSGSKAWLPWLALLGSWTSDSIFIIMVTFMFLLFPDGHLPSPKWRIVGWGTFLAILVNMVNNLFVPGPLSQSPLIENPLGIEPYGTPSLLASIFQVSLVLCISLCLISIFFRYRSTDHRVKRQIRWLAYFSIVLTGIVIVQSFVTADTWVYQMLNIIGGLILTSFPWVIGIAILRYQLFDIDLIIRRTALYTALTILLGLVYFGVVVILQELFGRITGQENSPLAIVISTLVIAALFNPLRVRLQNFIDRRFFRQKYNAEQALEVFAQTARGEVEIEPLTMGLISTIQETMQPERLSLWLEQNTPTGTNRKK